MKVIINESQFISQKYHEAKQNGSNPELVSVIEKL